jgi:hypothetical protein
VFLHIELVQDGVFTDHELEIDSIGGPGGLEQLPIDLIRLGRRTAARKAQADEYQAGLEV